MVSALFVILVKNEYSLGNKNRQRDTEIWYEVITNNNKNGGRLLNTELDDIRAKEKRWTLTDVEHWRSVKYVRY